MPRISTNSNEWKFVSFVAERNLNMSQVFFDELELPQPNVNLEVGSGSHAQQTALIMQRCERMVLDYRPDWGSCPATSTPRWPARWWPASWVSKWPTWKLVCAF